MSLQPCCYCDKTPRPDQLTEGRIFSSMLGRLRVHHDGELWHQAQIMVTGGGNLEITFSILFFFFQLALGEKQTGHRERV